MDKGKDQAKEGKGAKKMPPSDPQVKSETAGKKVSMQTQLRKAREAALAALAAQNAKVLKHQAFRKRVNLVKDGSGAYRAKKAGDAVMAFKSYLRLLEQDRNVGDGALKPSHFDSTKDLPELLILSGVYWDLAKLYDHSRSKENKKEFLHYLEKFLLFSKGMSFQKLCCDSVRRYLRGGKAIHKDEFKNTFKLLGGSECFVATALSDVCDPKTLPRLRDFRDEVLEQNALGRIFIDCYYFLGPKLAKATSQIPHGFRRALGKSLDWTSSLI